MGLYAPLSPPSSFLGVVSWPVWSAMAGLPYVYSTVQYSVQVSEAPVLYSTVAVLYSTVQPTAVSSTCRVAPDSPAGLFYTIVIGQNTLVLRPRVNITGTLQVIHSSLMLCRCQMS